MRRVWVIGVALSLGCVPARGPGPSVGEPTPASGIETRAPAVEAPERALQPVSARAAAGSRIFESRGCGACHTIGGGPTVGPDLAGVTVRRDPEWFRAMVTRPDSMLRADPRARALHDRFPARMPDLGVDDSDAEALWAFLALVAEPGAFADAVAPARDRAGPGTCRHHPGSRGRGMRGACHGVGRCPARGS